MKKLLSLVLLVMLFTLCFTLASCGGAVTTEEVEANAVQVYMDAMENTNNKFFVKDNEGSAFATIMSATEKGAVNISFSSETILPPTMSGINASIYFDSAAGKYAIKGGATVGEDELGGSIFVDKNGLILSSPVLFGSETAYALNLSSFIEKFETSFIGQMAGVTAEDFAEAKQFLTAFKTKYEECITSTEVNATGLLNTALKKLNPVVTEATLTIGGEEVDCIVVTYTLNNANIIAAAKSFVGDFATLANLGADEKTALLAQVDTMLEGYNFNCKLEIALNTEDNTFAKESITGTYSETGMEEYATTINITEEYTGSEMKVTQSFKTNGVDVTTSNITSRVETDETVAYELKSTETTVDENGKSNTQTVLKLLATYTKASGALSVTISTPANNGLGNDNLETITLSGKLDMTNGVKYTFTSVKMGGVAIDINAVIEFVPGTAVPSAGTTKDIVELTEEEFGELMNGIMEGPLGELINDMMGDPDGDIGGEDF